MDYRQAAQVIRDSVEMDQVLALYGYRANRQGFMCCPFHGEKEGSLKIYPKTGGWHCFGCGRGGSVIDFVQEQEGCGFRTAVAALDRAFSLGLIRGDENPMDAEEERKKQKWLDGIAGAMGVFLDELEKVVEAEQKTRLAMVKVLEERRDQDPRLLDPQDWNLIDSWKAEDEYCDYRKEQIRGMREEVAAWRRKHRARER